MTSQIHNQIVSFIWSIADDCLRDIYTRGKYRDVILPMTVIRRLDAVLEPTKDAVLAMKKNMDEAGINNQTPALCKAAGQAFCNASPFCLKDLTSRAKEQQLKADFIAYLDGFSPNVQEILEKFKFHVQIDTMSESGILGAVIEKFVSPLINLSPLSVLHDDGTERLPALDNHSMGTVFEELIRRFNEENNEEAGEHFTPRDVVELMADLIFKPIAHCIKDATYSCYDGASGTGGMLTVAEARLQSLAQEHGKKVSIHLFGQETAPETYAIAKADMLLKGDGEQADNIAFGSTLSADQFPTRQFDFMLSMRAAGEDRVEAYADRFGVEFYAGKKPWEVPVDIAMPCATQNELDVEDAVMLVANNVRYYVEAANMPATAEALKLLRLSPRILTAGSKASGSGGVVVSALEMVQNSVRYSWSRKEVDDRLRSIMNNIYDLSAAAATEYDLGYDLIAGSDIAAFKKISEAMIAQGL